MSEQWLLIGDKLHGKVVTIKANPNYVLHYVDGAINLYIKNSYLLNGIMYTLGVYNPIDEQLEEIETLIKERLIP